MATLNLLGWLSLRFYPLQSALFSLLLCCRSLTKEQESLEDLLTSIDSRRVPGGDQAGTEKEPAEGREGEKGNKQQPSHLPNAHTCGFLLSLVFLIQHVFSARATE